MTEESGDLPVTHTYNVLTPVVELIDAKSAAAAMRKHATALRRAGFEVYPDGAHAFISEDSTRPAPRSDA